MSIQNIMFNPKKYHKSQMKFHMILLPLSIFMSLPIVYIVNHAFKPFTELFAYPPRFLVRDATFENFRLLFNFSAESGIPMSRYIYNSVLITFLIVVFTVFFSSVSAFALSKLNFKGKSTMFKINTYALMFVPIAVAIPRYLIIVEMGIFNTIWAHIIPMLAMPVGLFLVKQFMDQVPDELIEAAIVDGASNWKIYTKIMLPLTKSALVTVAVLAFQASWMNTEASNIFVDKEALRTLPFYLNTLTQTSGNIVASTGVAAAASLIMFLPNFIIFLFLQSKVMESMAQSGIK
ncbi:carbohydrate ABC transporter permease [Haloplasma contractile]|uniref:Binding-protein-dependent transport systems inner membrane component n=1 Tax=Haloplasma contractile SSD-17B TaxID=1033810 RepID=U2FPU8_9MOLU|nr:carbohydrate ABC transporter permease [Haloplasma contractile]ERJ13064.1 Binding-protein-dependent transport systems inner membrane component [Haloplasma contractile SSD-17B]